MAAAKYRLTNRAILDLQKVTVYLTERSESAAVHVLESLHQTFQSIAQSPAIGESLDHYRPGTRKLMGTRPAQNYVVIYRIENDRIAISRVLHAARDWVPLVVQDAD
jgi:plasmid stabilization system protein ParE